MEKGVQKGHPFPNSKGWGKWAKPRPNEKGQMGFQKKPRGFSRRPNRELTRGVNPNPSSP